MTLTKENFHQLDHIPTEQVLADLEAGRSDAKHLMDKISVLSQRPQDNRVRIYLDEGHLRQQEEQNKMLEMLLQLRGFEIPQLSIHG